MTHLEFESEMKRLEGQWKGAYGDERKRVLFRALQRTDIEVFREAISECLVTHKTFPLLNELEREVRAVVERRREAVALNPGIPSQNVTNKYDCRECGNSGYAFMTDAKGYSYMYRCRCDTGRGMPAQAVGPRNVEGERESVFIPILPSLDPN